MDEKKKKCVTKCYKRLRQKYKSSKRFLPRNMSEIDNQTHYMITSSLPICRICVSKADIGGINLFSNERTSKDILDKIFLCFQIILIQKEYLPSLICENCAKELACADKFRVNCISFEERFNSLKQVNMTRNAVELLDNNVFDDEEQVEDAKEIERGLPYTTETIIVDNIKKTKEYQCDICKKTLKSKVSLTKHIISMHQERKHDGRMTGHGANRKYHCTKCSYSTIYSQTLVNHMRRHNGEKPYHCHCGKSFTQAASLATHEKTHSNIMAHICSTCGKQFRHAFSLKKHLLVHETGQFACNICQKCLKTEYSLTAHMNRHYNIRNYSCEECGDTFVTSTDLINHRKKHSAEKKAECHLCDYKTRAKKNLISHLKRHAGDKSFECDICSKALYTRSDLRRHMRVHSREKPYPCPLCAQRFSQPGSLNQHVRNLHSMADYQWSRAQPKAPVVKQEK